MSTAENIINIKNIVEGIENIINSRRNILVLRGGFYIGDIYMWDDGTWYYGETINNYAHGKGIYNVRVDDGVFFKYIGSFKNGCSNGYGICKTSDGEYYKGTWCDGLRHGYGTTYMQNGITEIGNYVLGVQDGWFKYVYSKTRSNIAGYTVYYDMGDITEYGELL